MKVHELVAKLLAMPQDYNVVVLDNDGRPTGDTPTVSRGRMEEDPSGSETFIQDDTDDTAGFVAIGSAY